MMDNVPLEVLATIRPQRAGVIMDLIAEAGVDVSPWRVRRDGSPVENPRANPAYCYEWAFGGGTEPVVLCVWHELLSDAHGEIRYEDNFRQHALKLDVVALDRANPAKDKSRARAQATRARNFDSLLQRAFRKAKSVRVLLLTGDLSAADAIGWDTSNVKFRELDAESWFVHNYSDADGAFRLVRGAAPIKEDTSSKQLTQEPAYADQFSVPEPPEKRAASGTVFVRSEQVRQSVLRRAAGICEHCGASGFKTDDGAIFLETHHVVALSEDGLDVEWNVVAICPNDHRRAHRAHDREAIREQLVQRLSNAYPAMAQQLHALVNGEKRLVDRAEPGQP